MFKNITRGQMLVELLLVIGLSAIIFPALLTGFIASREAKPQQKQRMQAVTLLKETEQAVTSARDMGWASIATFSAVPLHPVIYNGRWNLTLGSETINGFTRQIVISDVYRTVSGAIVPFSTPDSWKDPSTKQVTVTMSWDKPYASSINSAFYLTRAENLSSNIIDLNGIFNHTQRVSPSDYIILENNQKGKWCSPAFTKDSFGTEVTIDLPDGPPVAVTASSAATISTPNDVFVATAPTDASSIKLAYINVTANTDPPSPSLRGIFTLNPAEYNPSYIPTGIGLDNNFKTNDVQYYKSPSGKLYALMATNLPDKEVVVVQINDGTGDAYQDPGNKIYKYWTFFNTIIYPNGVASHNTDFLNPTANSADTGGDGDGFAPNPENAYLNDSNYARDIGSGTNTSIDYTNSGKDRHRFFNYNISLPSDAAVTGIVVRLDARLSASCTSSPQTRKMYIELSWNGGTSWTAAQSTNNLSTSSMTTYTLGGSTNIWGRSWTPADFTNANFRVRITNVANSTSCEFRLDWVPVKVYYNSAANDEAPFGHGATSIAIMENTGYVASGGYLYVFDLTNIDSMTEAERINTGLPMQGCRILLDGFECTPGHGHDHKYAEGESGTTWSSTSTAAHPDTCADGGNIELYSTNDIYPVKVGSNKYIYAAIGAGTMPEFEIADVSTVPSDSRSEETSCGRGTDTGWKVTDTIDFYAAAGEEAANSVFAKSDGTRAYVTSNGGGDSKQFYVIDTVDKSAIRFLSGTSSPPTSGFYYGSSPQDELFVRRSMVVLNGERVVLVGKDGYVNSDDAQEYQVINMSAPNSEASPAYCGGLNYDQGFNDLTSLSEADGDNFVYMVTNTTDHQLKIIQGGPDGTYVGSGDYTSPPMDAEYSTTFNSFNATTTTSPGVTTLDFQFAVASPSAGQDCTDTTYAFTGPGGDPNTHYATTSAAIWLGNSGNYRNPGRCLKYKSFLGTSNYDMTPELKSMIINYSP